MGIVLIVIGLVEAAAFVAIMHFSVAKKSTSVKKSMDRLEQALAEREEAKVTLESLYDKMIDVGTLRSKAEEFQALQESLKAERGRITITQAELETVETRLRELEEIERELEASGIETKEELNILRKKKEELSDKNQKLKEDLERSMQDLDSVLGEIEVSAQMQEQVDNMRTELVQTQEKIEVLLQKIEDGNEQYFILKRRYDALDIEYAQLYEKQQVSAEGDM